MALDPDHLLNYCIPPVRQHYSRQDSAFYALSLGFGADPMDEAQLSFVDANRDVQALPCMAVVLGHPGFWLGNPDTGVDALRLVHAEQSVEWRSALPPEGEVIGRTRVTGLVDKGPGKGALLYSEKVLSDAVSGEVYAITRGTTFLRGDGGFGGDRQSLCQPHRVPERTPELVVDLPTRSEQALYYRLNGDDNPIHSSPATAAKGGFERPILHGLCTLGVAYHALLRGLADYRVERFAHLQARFCAPVFPGETLRTEMWNDGSFRTRVVERDLLVLDNGLVSLAQEESN
ncbi:MaoC family dehydratase N-terminal domain-containing protein [Pseudomonas sp. P66]|jgi:acyl dehydratase|uniref:MaoC family dehydratase N-terminal domain-containing protein n=1 Tax=Pseudomonas arcuscaelestis TaxID=2710591 RepID=A0ABS2C6M6_9PSED|nr:MaoC family dehydratase [Pseudomonas arcuscaelestis]MBM5460881.1 MaoC family dehydratase N-terminal domain-containing protein [Pseudomonas arcuscaelestis]